MVCMKTAKAIEFSNDELVALRNRICAQYGWEPVGHRFQIFAISPQDHTREQEGEDSPRRAAEGRGEKSRA